MGTPRFPELPLLYITFPKTDLRENLAVDKTVSWVLFPISSFTFALIYIYQKNRGRRASLLCIPYLPQEQGPHDVKTPRVLKVLVNYQNLMLE